MIVGSIPVVSPQVHRRIDQFTFPTLLAAAALMYRRNRMAGHIALATAAVEGTAYLITDYPPAVLPLISFRAHNKWAFAHGLLVGALALSLPGIPKPCRWGLYAMAASSMSLATVSDTRGG